jgi:hypothetical protein
MPLKMFCKEEAYESKRVSRFSFANIYHHTRVHTLPSIVEHPRTCFILASFIPPFILNKKALKLGFQVAPSSPWGGTRPKMGAPPRRV